MLALTYLNEVTYIANLHFVAFYFVLMFYPIMIISFNVLMNHRRYIISKQYNGF